MSCERMRDLVLLFLAGELAEEESELLRPHLLSCAACTRFMSDQRRLLRELQAASEIEPSDGFAARTSATIARGLRARRTSPLTRLAARPGAAWVAGIAAGLLVFAALRWLPAGIPDLPFDLAFLNPAGAKVEPAAVPVAAWDSADVDEALRELRADVALYAPAAPAAVATAAESTSGADEDPWDTALCALERKAQALEWDVTSSGRSRWSTHVGEIEDRLDELALGLDE